MNTRKLIIGFIVLLALLFAGYTLLGTKAHFDRKSRVYAPKPVAIAPPPPPSNICTDLKEAAKTGCTYVPPEKLEEWKREQAAVAKSMKSSPVPAMDMPPVSSTMSFEVAGLKLAISEQTPWESIFKLIATVLLTHLGIRLTNKYVKA